MLIDNDFILSNCVPALAGHPFDYQYEGIKTLFKKNRFLISDDPGLGKTIQIIVAINLIQRLRENPLPLKVLVIGTKSIVINWGREVKKWSNCSAEYTIINHDKMIAKDHEKYIRNWDIVVADESHFYLKNQSTMRAKMFLQISSTAERIWLSTATPASKCASDYFLTLKILLPELFGRWHLGTFKKKYCRKIPEKYADSGYVYKGFNEQTLSELNKVFKVCALGRKQEEVKKDLPPLTFSNYFADVNKSEVQGFTTKELQEIQTRVWDGVELSAEYQGKLRHNALLKIPSILELLNTYPEDKKVVIFVWHREVADKLVTEIKATERQCAKITGEVSSAEARQAIIDLFQDKTSGLNHLVLNMQSGGVGINLTAATVGIYAQFPSVATFWIQSIKRIHRIGSTDPVQIIKCMIEHSIDEDIFSTLEERLEYIERVGLQSRGAAC